MTVLQKYHASLHASFTRKIVEVRHKFVHWIPQKSPFQHVGQQNSARRANEPSQANLHGNWMEIIFPIKWWFNFDWNHHSGERCRPQTRREWVYLNIDSVVMESWHRRPPPKASPDGRNQPYLIPWSHKHTSGFPVVSGHWRGVHRTSNHASVIIVAGEILLTIESVGRRERDSTVELYQCISSFFDSCQNGSPYPTQINHYWSPFIFHLLTIREHRFDFSEWRYLWMAPPRPHVKWRWNQSQLRWSDLNVCIGAEGGPSGCVFWSWKSAASLPLTDVRVCIWENYFRCSMLTCFKRWVYRGRGASLVDDFYSQIMLTLEPISELGKKWKII